MNQRTLADRVTVALLAGIAPEQRVAIVSAGGAVDDRLGALIREVQGMALEDPSAALSASSWIVELADECASALSRSLAHCARAYTLGVTNHFEDSLVVLEDARSIAREAGDDVALAHVEHNTVQPLARLGRHSEAIQRATEAVRLFEAGGEAKGAARARCNLGLVWRMRDEPERALAQYDAALASLGDEPMLAAQIQSNRAEALLDRADFRAAEYAFRAALGAFKEAGAGHAAAFVEGNLADLLGRQGRMNGALRHFQFAIDRLESAGVRGDAARLEAERAEVLARVGLLDDAARSFNAALAVLDEAGLIQESARARVGLARTLVRMRHTGFAVRALQEAGDRFARIESTLGVARVNIARAWMMMDDGKIEQAKTLLRDALVTCRDSPVDCASVLVATSHVLIHDGLFREARQRIDEAMGIAEDLDLRPLIAELLHARGRALMGDGKVRSALEALSEGVEQVERLRGLLVVDRQRAAWTGQQTDIYRCLAQAALALSTDQGIRLAFRAVEQAKARSLLDIVRGGIELAEHLRTGDEEVGEGRHLSRLATARADLNALYSWRSEGTEGGSQLSRAEWRRRVEALEREVATIEGRMASTRRFAAIFAQPSDLTDVQALLLHDTRIVEYFRTENEIGAFVIGPDTIEVCRAVCGAATLKDAAERTAFQLRRGVSRSAERPSKRSVELAARELGKLHALVLGPLVEHLRDAKRLVFVPHGDLYGVPFHALHDGNGYLIEQYDVLYAPSASLLTAVSKNAGERGSMATGPGLIVGVADDAAPQIRAEALDVASASIGTTHLLDEEATVARFEEAARKARFVHVACHGEFPPATPMSARIRLGERWVTAREIFGMTFSGPVVLSCCDVGRSTVLRGDEIFGMVRAFLAAGAPSIITGLWPAHDAATRQLMRSMYELTSPHEETPTIGMWAAFCESQRRLLRDWPHPTSWATMLCVGGL